MDRDESEYQTYADTITKWTTVSGGRGRVLDLGCGTYRTPQLIQERGFLTTGCDLFSPEKLRTYQEAVGPNGPLLVSYDGKKLPFGEAEFDTVASLCVFEHVPDVDAMLFECHRILKPGGRHIVLGPNLGGPHRLVLAMNHLIRGKGRYSHYPTLGSLFSAGMKQGFWTMALLLSGKPEFVYKYPYILNDQIRFEQPDDDAIQLNLPVSYRNWFHKQGYRLRQYNRGAGSSGSVRFFNRLFPSFGTTLQIVAEKPKES